MAHEVELDWDDENTKHLAAHNVMPAEFEQAARLLSVVWTVRDGKLRAVTAFPASASDKKAFLKVLR